MTQRTSPVRRVALETAWAWLDSQAQAGSEEKKSVDIEVAGRIIARDVLGATSLPASDIAVIDGFAVRADAILGASDYNLIRLSLDPGEGTGAGRAIAVVAGKPVPAGFDTVLPIDCVERSEGTIEVATAVPRGNGVVRTGQAATAGSCLLPAGTCLSPTDIMLLREAGCGEVVLKERPKVAMVSFGAKSGTDTSCATLAHLIGRDSAVSAATDFDGLTTTLRVGGGFDADLILMVGRSGWGDDDVADALIREHGSLDHHGLALRPCSSVGFGRIGGTPLVLLPGDPLSAWVAYELLVARLLRRWNSMPSYLAYGSERRILNRKIASPVGTADWVPLLYEDDGKVTPIPIPAGWPLAVLGRAQGFALIPAASEGAAPGDSLTVHPLKSGMRNDR